MANSMQFGIKLKQFVVETGQNAGKDQNISKFGIGAIFIWICE